MYHNAHLLQFFFYNFVIVFISYQMYTSNTGNQVSLHYGDTCNVRTLWLCFLVSQHCRDHCMLMLVNHTLKWRRVIICQQNAFIPQTTINFNNIEICWVILGRLLSVQCCGKLAVTMYITICKITHSACDQFVQGVSVFCYTTESTTMHISAWPAVT